MGEIEICGFDLAKKRKKKKPSTSQKKQMVKAEEVWEISEREGEK